MIFGFLGGLLRLSSKLDLRLIEVDEDSELEVGGWNKAAGTPPCWTGILDEMQWSM